VGKYSKKEVSKTLKINLDKVKTRSRKKEALNDIAEFVLDSILDRVGDGKSPVHEENKKFKRLNPDYANKEKGGDRLPNLDLEGDMLDSLKSKINLSQSEITIGVFNDQAAKAYGHNTGFKGHPNKKMRNPSNKRRFIPRESQKFDKEIRDGIREIVREYEDESS
jgi:hypothetical protein